MLCNSPASLSEGGGGKGAGGGLGIQPHYDIHKPKVISPIPFTPLAAVEPSVPSRPRTLPPPSRRGGGGKSMYFFYSLAEAFQYGA